MPRDFVYAPVSGLSVIADGFDPPEGFFDPLKHFVRFLFEDYGLDAVRERVIAPIESLNFEVPCGCHYTKPGHAHGHFDDPSCPTTLDELMQRTGAKTIEYPNKNLC